MDGVTWEDVTRLVFTCRDNQLKWTREPLSAPNKSAARRIVVEPHWIGLRSSNHVRLCQLTGGGLDAIWTPVAKDDPWVGPQNEQSWRCGTSCPVSAVSDQIKGLTYLS